MKTHNVGSAVIALLCGMLLGFTLAASEITYFFREVKTELSQDLAHRLTWAGIGSMADGYSCKALNGGDQILCVKEAKK